MKIQQEYKQKLKEAETKRRIQRAITIGEVNVRKYQQRDELVQKVKLDAIKKLGLSATKDQGKYGELLKQLIIQGLIKLNESKVEVQCREGDAKLVNSILGSVAKEYEKMIKESVGESVKIEITVSNKYLATSTNADGSPSVAADGTLSCSGGVKILAKGGRIVCDNTLDSRLKIAFDDLMPVIRQMLFSPQAA